jgi:hypothetical protein
LFARYSRSAKSLRRLFLDEFVSDLDLSGDKSVDATIGLDRAESLYEKIFVEYGDDSVAQLGFGHAAVQCLFATQARAGGLRPVGLVIYLRDGADLLTVLHVGLSPAYAAGGLHAEANLLGRLMHEVKRVARRTGGIRKLLVAYRALRGPAAARTGVALAS